MKAIVQTGYGSKDVLELQDVEKPGVGDEDVLVRVRACGLHRGDYFMMMGSPWLTRVMFGLSRPRAYVAGYSEAGVVEAAGKNVTRFKPGDEVFGGAQGGCAEYVRASAENLAPKPADLTWEEASVVATSALAALHALRDQAKVQPGQKVLVNGASGGVGTFAVQIAKWLGAEVTGVCSTHNVELVRSLGADRVVDYTREDFTRTGESYDVILDNIGNRSFGDLKRALTPKGAVLPNTGSAGMSYIIGGAIRSLYDRRQGRLFVSYPNAADMQLLSDLLSAGTLKVALDRTYDGLAHVPEGVAYIGEGHARGKVAVTVAEV
jgi:NADPH:quinone reductase-like Zn-dependent oxidoreductase